MNLSAKLVRSFFIRTRTELIFGVIVFFFAATLVAASSSAAEQGIYPEKSVQKDLNLDVEITPLEPGLNTITLHFEESTDIQGVRIDMSMPPNWRIERKAFKVDKGTYKLTGNLLHAAGTVNMNIKVDLKNGEDVEIPYKIVVPGETRINES